MGDTRGNTIYIKEEDIKNMSLDKLAKMTRDNNVVFLSGNSLSYEYLCGWYDGAREVMKIFSKGDK